MADHQVTERSPRVTSLQWFIVGLRALMELGIVAGLGYWGYQAGNSTSAKVLLAILTPSILFGFWGLVDFHRAGRAAEPLRLLQELVISGITAVALFAAGQPALAWAMVTLSVVYHALVYLSGGRLLTD